MGKFPKDEIEELMRRIIRGDSSAFTQLYTLKKENLVQIAYTYLGDYMLAEDVAEDVFIELVERVGRFEFEKNLNGWLNITTINKSLNLIKERKREVFAEYPQSSECYCGEIDTERIHINDCMRKLDEDERNVLYYRENGYTIREITKNMGKTTKQVRGLIERARKKFKDFYK